MMIRTTRFRAAVAGIALVALALTGCSGASTSQSSGNGPTLTLYNGGSGAFAENWNPFSPTVLSNVTGFIYEPLFFFNGLKSAGTKATPVLGKSYSWNSAGTKLSVTVDSGVTWNDGKPFTAEDVAYTFNLIASTPTLDTTGNPPTAKATDDTHVVLTFKRASFVEGPTVLGTTYIVPKHVWSSISNPDKTINKNPVGTGPMMVSSFTPQSYLLTKNPKFRDASRVEVGGVRLLSLSGNEAAANQLLAGQLDWSGINIPNVGKILKPKPQLGFFQFGSAQVDLSTCSNAALGCTGPQTDPVVRHAIEAAVDRAQLIKLGNSGNGSPISATYALLGRDDAFIAPKYKGAESMKPNVTKAESLLESDGWAKGKDGIYAKDGKRLSMTVQVTAGYTNYISALSVLTQQLKAAGIEISTRQMANSENNSSQGLGHFQLAISNLYQGPAADPYYVYANFFSSTNTGKVGESVNPYGNVARFSDPKVDAAIAAAASTEDLTERAAQYAKIQDVIVDDLPYIPLFNSANMAQYSTSKVTGWPSASNPYAQLSPGSAPDNEQVLLHLKAVG